jgi:hypothetical protein
VKSCRVLTALRREHSEKDIRYCIISVDLPNSIFVCVWLCVLDGNVSKLDTSSDRLISGLTFRRVGFDLL